MSKKIALILLSCVAVLGLFLYSHNAQGQGTNKLTIGIIQTASHPALDQVREGFISEIKALANQEVDFVTQNAEGSLSQAQSIAANFHAHKKIKAILAIGTPAVQTIARVEKEKPIFISAVSDPKALGLTQNLNICGSTDRIDTEAQARLIVELVPQARTIAILYNPGESNSQAMVKKMQESLEKIGLKTALLGVHTENEITLAINLASRRGEVLLVPADNLLVSAMPFVSKEALKNKLPLVVSDIPSVTKGALAAKGADYRDLGKQTAELALRVLLKGESPQSVAIQDPLNTKTIINQTTLKSLQIALPEKLAQQSAFVGSKGEKYE